MDPKWKDLAREWLSQKALPLWLEHGVDPKNGSFIENLSREGRPMAGAQRAMVQGRQMYAFTEAARMGFVPRESVESIVLKATKSFIERYSLPSGAFAHAVTPEGERIGDLDLYAQAFGLFGLANAYELTGDLTFKERAKSLLKYLREERLMTGGGYSEVVNGEVCNKANPHMHLFEAALAWLKVDGGGRSQRSASTAQHEWRTLADDIYKLCVSKFIDADSGALCENFERDWSPRREGGHFIFEPGHHYEWAWLLISYQELTGVGVGDVARRLFDMAEANGINPENGMVYDEVWSDKRVKKSSSRFWPQSERIKAALSLRKPTAADQSMESLFKFLSPTKPGLWEDTLGENGQFISQPVKASSLYHIICAFSEYIRKR